MTETRQDVQLRNAGNQDRQFELEFRFERGTIELDHGELFSPQEEALRRWEEFTPAYLDWVGSRFDLLYELRDGRFVQLTYEMCHQQDGPDGPFWSSGSPPAGRVVTPAAAAQFLLQRQQSLPLQLKNAYEEWVRTETELAIASPRPLSHWLQRTPPGSVYQLLLTQERLRLRIDEVTRILFLFVEDYRGTLSLQTDREEYDPQVLARELWAWDKFNIDDWDWGTGKHPPAVIDWLEAPWPKEWRGIRSTLLEVRQLLSLPMPCLMHRWLSDLPDTPTDEEQQAAEDVVRERLGDLERLSASLQRDWIALRNSPLSQIVTASPATEPALVEVLPLRPALIHRPDQGGPPGLELRPGGFRLGDRDCKMCGTSLAILSVFAQRRNRTVTERELNLGLWGANSVEPASVAKAVSRLRQELRRLLGMPRGFNPLPAVDRGPALAWRLDLEFTIVTPDEGHSVPAVSRPSTGLRTVAGPFPTSKCA